MESRQEDEVVSVPSSQDDEYVFPEFSSDSDREKAEHHFPDSEDDRFDKAMKSLVAGSKDSQDDILARPAKARKTNESDSAGQKRREKSCLDPAYLNRIVRIVNADNGRTLYAHTNGNPDGEAFVGAGPNRLVSSDGNWRIIGDRSRNGSPAYRILNVNHNRVLHAHPGENLENGFGVGWRDNHVEDGLWHITKNRGPDGSFRIENAVSERLLYAEYMGDNLDGWEEQVGAFYPRQGVRNEGDWHFILTAMPSMDQELPEQGIDESTAAGGLVDDGCIE